MICRCGSGDWQFFGRFRLADGRERRRFRCRSCGKTHTEGSPRSERRASDAVGRFWEFVAGRFVAVGLSRAIRSAARDVGLSAATASRLVRPATVPLDVRRPWFSDERYKLLEDCLRSYVARNDTQTELPCVQPPEGQVMEIGPEVARHVVCAMSRARGIAVLLSREGRFPSWLDAIGGADVSFRELYPASSFLSTVCTWDDFILRLARITPEWWWRDDEARAWLERWTNWWKSTWPMPSWDGDFEAAVASDPPPVPDPGELLILMQREYSLLESSWDPSRWDAEDDDIDRGLDYWLATPPGRLEVLLTNQRRLISRAQVDVEHSLPAMCVRIGRWSFSGELSEKVIGRISLSLRDADLILTWELEAPRHWHFALAYLD